MTRSLIRVAIITGKIEIVRRMFAGIAALPLASSKLVHKDPELENLAEEIELMALPFKKTPA